MMKDLKIGVFICDCGGELSRLLDFESLEKWARSLSGVSLVKRFSFLCGESGRRELCMTLKGDVDRVLIVACTPKILEYTLRRTLENEGLQPHLVEIVNIREQCLWPHRGDLEGAEIKAKRMILGGLERIKRLREVERRKFPVKKAVLVIGGGVAGIHAAMDLADFGYETHLIEKDATIGGNALKLGLAFPTDDGAFCIASPSLIEGMRKCLYRSGLILNPNLRIHTLTELVDLEGSFGNFRARLKTRPRGVNEELCINCGRCSEVCPVEVMDKERLNSPRKAIYLPHPNAIPQTYLIDWDKCTSCGECVESCPTNAIDLTQKDKEFSIDVGAIILASGIQEFDPTPIKQYKYGVDEDVVTQLELARMLDPYGPTQGEVIKPSTGEKPKSVVMIQCVGSRDEKFNPYCSKICCMFALKHAIEIKEKYGSDIDVCICYMDIRAGGKGYEDYYSRARMLGVRFLRGKPSEIDRSYDGSLRIMVEDTLESEVLELNCDLVVLSVGLVPSSGTDRLAEILGINLDKEGFVREIYSKLKPINTNVKGIYVCGGAQAPKDIPESVTQAKAAALQAILDLSKETEKYVDVAYVDVKLCDGCELCMEVCPYNAIEMVTEKINGELKTVASVIEVKCNRCGLCMSRCPTGAIQLYNYEDDILISQIAQLLSDENVKPLHPKIVTFCCDECGYATVDLAGKAGLSYPANILPIRVPCLGWVSLYQIFKSLELGADGVLLVGCKIENCQHLEGAKNAKNIVEFANRILEEVGLGADRIRMVDVCAVEPYRFVEEAERFTRALSRTKPLSEVMRGG